ncbi:MAG: hypothetical protein QOF85_1976 [Solirubrobacterales bacterium]|jgi:5-methylcytosine-specific restriction endonuclease McrA|nr:hypothetical protein [Solirubrobacterales bacterium]
MLRADKNAEVVRLPWSFAGMFTGRYALMSGRRIFDVRWKDQWYQSAATAQWENPVPLVGSGKRTYWWFHECIYWDDDALTGEDVKALVLQRERSHRRKLETAHSLMRAEATQVPVRVPVPEEVRRVIFEPDGGRCVECGSNFDLQYDHILPVSRGGATSVENLQLLCSDCNRQKGDSL